MCVLNPKRWGRQRRDYTVTMPHGEGASLLSLSHASSLSDIVHIFSGKIKTTTHTQTYIHT